MTMTNTELLPVIRDSYLEIPGPFVFLLPLGQWKEHEFTTGSILTLDDDHYEIVKYRHKPDGVVEISAELRRYKINNRSRLDDKH